MYGILSGMIYDSLIFWTYCLTSEHLNIWLYE